MSNLLHQLCNYNANDIPITGNPMITYFARTTDNLKYRPYTNFACAYVNIQPTGFTPNTITWANIKPSSSKQDIIPDDVECKTNLSSIGDLVLDFIICIRSFEDLKKIIISIGEFDPIELTKEYIQIYNKTCSPIIFESESECIITFNLVNLFCSSQMPNACFYIGLPVIHEKLNINWICVCVREDNLNYDLNQITLKTKSVVLGNEERRAFCAKSNLTESKIINLEYFETVKPDGSFWNLMPNSKLPIGVICCLISNFELLESIEIIFNNNKITLTSDILKIFNEFYEPILFDFGEKKLIKLKNLIQMHFNNANAIEKYHLKINYMKINYMKNTYVSNNKVYFCLHSQQDLPTNTPVVLNKLFYGSYYQNESIITDELNRITINPDQSNLTHIKEIFIYFTNLQTGNKERVINLLTIQIGTEIINKYSNLDLDIYQETTHSEHSNKSKSIYSIGYGLYPKNNYPSGLVNVSKEPIKFTFELKSGVKLRDYRTTILFFGYKVFSDNL